MTPIAELAVGLEAVNPYLIEGPALINFSGGRTSAYMLFKILEAHGGMLPDDVIVQFSNTGKEREETLRFVHECGSRWGVPIHWLEWRDQQPGYEEVGYNSAARKGEPFSALIAARNYLPNAVTRFCSVVLKVRTAKAFAQKGRGWKHWTSIIGLRHDEGHRLLKMYARNDTNREPFKAAAPLSKARVTKRDVLTFWLGPTMRLDAGVRPQGFDLELLPFEGNCDGCFLKAYAKLAETERRRPGTLDWWAAEEVSITGKAAKKSGARFVTEYTYASIQEAVRTQVGMVFDGADDEADAECGDVCG